MFNVGDFIIYGSNGVCKVTNVGPMKMSGIPKDKMYYTMVPCYIRDSEIFTPVDNERVVMRKVMSREERKNAFFAKSKGPATEGPIKEVVLCGYKNLKNGRILQPSLVRV